MVFLPKGRGRYRDIGLVEVVWKVCAAAVNFRLKRSVMLYDALHGFRAGMGKGTATLKQSWRSSWRVWSMRRCSRFS